MKALLAIAGMTNLIVILALLAYNLFVRKYHLLSWRNLFLLGFAHFQCLGAYFTATMVTPHTVRYTESEDSHLILAILTPIFFILFMVCAKIGMSTRLASKYIPPVELPPCTPGILIGIAGMLGFGLIFAIMPPNSYLGLLGVQFRGGLATASVALATYIMLAKRFNPLSWGIFFTVLALAAIVATTGSSTRRPLLSVMVAIPWMWYFFVLRFRPNTALVSRFAVGAVAILLVLAVYSGARRIRGEGSADFGNRASTLAELIQNPQVSAANAATMLYTDTTLNTLFIIDNYPEQFPYQPLHGAKFVLGNPIPRFFWPGKPIALGIIIQDQMQVDANLGPGIIGHGWQEAGAAGVIVYAIFFGLVVGFADRTITERAHNPYFLAVMVSGAGNLIGLPRGDTPLFFLQVLASAISAGAILYLTKLSFGALLRASPPALVRLPKDAVYGVEWDDAYVDGGEDEEYGEYEDGAYSDDDLVDPEMAGHYAYDDQ